MRPDLTILDSIIEDSDESEEYVGVAVKKKKTQFQVRSKSANI